MRGVQRGGSSLINDMFVSIDAIPSVLVPLLVIHGDQDELVPPEHGQDLFEAAGSNVKTLAMIPGV